MSNIEKGALMDTNKMREQFEAWVAKNYVVPPGVGHLFVRAELGDGYRLSNINHAWRGWQASREAVVVELPPIWEQGSNTALGQACAQIRTADIEAIKAQGLKVKP